MSTIPSRRELEALVSYVLQNADPETRVRLERHLYKLAVMRLIAVLILLALLIFLIVYGGRS